MPIPDTFERFVSQRRSHNNPYISVHRDGRLYVSAGCVQQYKLTTGFVEIWLSKATQQMGLRWVTTQDINTRRAIPAGSGVYIYSLPLATILLNGHTRATFPTTWDTNAKMLICYYGTTTTNTGGNADANNSG